MTGITVFGRKLTRLLLSAALASGCGTAYYYLNEANAKLKPILPPLAAERNLHDWLHSSNLELMENEPLFHLGLVSDIYQRVDYKLLWLNNYELSSAGRLLLQQLAETSADNALEYNYHLSYLQQRLYNLPTRPKDATAVDILLTDAFISYAEDVLSDKLTTEYLTANHQAEPSGLRNASLQLEPIDNAHNEHSYITSLITENDSAYKLSDMLTGMHPVHDGYAKLREALLKYQNIAASGKWQPIDEGTTLRSGQQHPQVAQLRTMLKLYSDYPVPKNSTLFSWLTDEEFEEPQDLTLFDDELVAALKHFQKRHGKKATGVLDKKTRALLNIPPSQRIKQLSYNMKRWRELPEQLGERYIWVNLSDYRLDVIHKERSVMDMKVIVGKTSRRTPIMRESINSVVLNPSWNVPRRIMIYDILPQLRDNPDYLKERNIRIIEGWTNLNEIESDSLDLANISPRQFPYRLQQDPGEDNALGVIKFVIPNDYSIYLHDTNHRELFKKDYRALSSGCIRVEKPRELAELLLQDKRGWDRQQIEKTIAGGQTTYVRLPQQIPTYLLYWTAWVDRDGVIQFRDDIYSLDSLITQKSDATLVTL